MAGAAKVTTNHDEIKQWIESHGGKPSCVKATKNQRGCLLRVDFPGYSGGDSLEELDWETFFSVFDENDLVFLHGEDKGSKESRFNKFVSKESAEAKGH